MKKALKILLLAFSAALIIAAGYIAYLIGTYPENVEDEGRLIAYSSNDFQVPVNKTLSVLLCDAPDYSDENELSNIRQKAAEYDISVFLKIGNIKNKTGLNEFEYFTVNASYSYSYAENINLNDPLCLFGNKDGINRSGMLCISGYDILRTSKRYGLGHFGGLRYFALPDLAFSRTDIPCENGRKLCIFAFDSLAEYFEDTDISAALIIFLNECEKEYSKGNYCIAFASRDEKISVDEIRNIMTNFYCSEFDGKYILISDNIKCEFLNVAGDGYTDVRINLEKQ